MAIMNGRKSRIVVSLLLGCVMLGCMSLEEKLASSDYETRKSGEIELFQNAARSGSEAELRNAISRMTCGEVLASAVMSVNSVDLKKLAVSRIEDDRMLASLAVYASNMEVQGAAVEKMKDQPLLLATYEAVTNADLKVKVLGRMAPEVIAALPYDRCLAKRWDCVSNETILVKIIVNDLHEIQERDWQPLITKATEKSDKKVRNEIESELALLYAEHYDSLTKEAREVVVANLKDSTLLEKMITKVDDYEIEKAERAWKDNVSQAQEAVEYAEKEVEKSQQRVKQCRETLDFLGLPKAKAWLEKTEKRLALVKREAE